MALTDLPTALEDGGPGPPHSLPADDVSGDVHLCVHEASLLQGDVVVQVRLDGGSLLGHDFGFDGCDFLHRHGLRQRSEGGTDTFEQLALEGAQSGFVSDLY